MHFAPLFIIAAYCSCIILKFMAPGMLYDACFIISLAALAAVCAYVLLRLKILRPVFYFFLMNTALFFGLIRYFGGIKSAAWTRNERLSQT